MQAGLVHHVEQVDGAQLAEDHQTYEGDVRCEPPAGDIGGAVVQICIAGLALPLERSLERVDTEAIAER